MGVATFSAALTSGVVFALPTADSTACNNCKAVRMVLSVAFVAFTISLFVALFMRIALRTEPNDRSKRKRWLSLNLSVSRFLMICCSGFLAAGFILIGVGLILIGEPQIGGLTIALVGCAGFALIIWFFLDQCNCTNKT